LNFGNNHKLCFCFERFPFILNTCSIVTVQRAKLRISDANSTTSVPPFFPWRWGGSSTQEWMPTYVSISRIPQMIWVWRATVEWYWQGKTEELWEKPVPVPLCPPQIPHGLTRAWTRASAARGRRLTTWAIARPGFTVCTGTKLH
jgi:hypothetical protein